MRLDFRSRQQLREQSEIPRQLGRRGLLIGGLQLVTAGVILGRMHHLQVDQADEFRLLAEENRVNFRLIPPARGLIHDINGIPLAVNEQNYRIVLVREDAGDVARALERLGQVVALSPEAVARTIEESARSSPFVPITVMERVSWEDVARVTMNAPALPGISAEVGLSRAYPRGADTAHVVGYVGPVSDYDLSQMEDPDPLMRIPRFQIGKTGVEARLEDTLRGEAGTRRIEVNAVGRIMRELDRVEGVAGKDVQLTLDARLQAYVEARLETEASASVVVLDCQTGDIRAVGNTPTFDPNLFVRGISSADWTALNENPFRPLSAKAVQGTYPPGSTFKMVTALAALTAGVVDPDETVRCNGYTEISGTRFHCWRSSGHGNVTLNASLQQSCDCYYYEVGQRATIDNIAAMARLLGLGVRHDLPMSAVAQGLAPDRAWKIEVRGEDWRVGDTVNASIGQGYVLASPLQLAVMTARIATGLDIRPRLVHRIGGIEQPSGRGGSLGLNENHLLRIRQGMFDVLNSDRGTARESRVVADGLRLAGKTGTSQVRRITPEERARGVTSNDQLPWERRDHALWVNFAPFDNPRFAVAVVVEHGGGGSTAAAPIGRDVTLQAIYDGDPPLEAYPANWRARIRDQQERIRTRLAGAAAGGERA
ncbi:MAG: penicillin-binding protein 2 [Rubellimicrobium sp.]|nr:penicillin-binding protein 2 [Rubellimicrobium sp.]